MKKRKKVGLTVCESVVSSQLGTRLLKIEKILKGAARHDSSQKIEVFYSKNKNAWIKWHVQEFTPDDLP